MPPLPKSPERQIVQAFLDVLRADLLFSQSFDPITLVESPSVDALLAFASGQCSVGYGGAKPVDKPSKRQTSLVAVLVSLYFEAEPTSEDSDLLGADWMSYLRTLAWGLVLNAPVGGAAMNFATTSILPLTPLITVEGVRIFSYRVTFETDIDPTQGTFI